MNQGTNLGSQKGRWIVLAALVAVLGALLFLLPGGILQAQQTAETFYHHENNGEPVVTLTADDPEGVTPIYWSILDDDMGVQDLPGGVDGDDVGDADVPDFDSFNVKDGVLMFNEPPDYEDPADVTGGPTEDEDNNTYKVVVQASDGGVTQWVQYFKVTVIVLDLEEEGDVTWAVDANGDGVDDGQTPDVLLEFQAGAILTATVTDPDTITTPVANETWKWYRSSSNTGPWTEIADTPANGTYPVSDHADNNDVGMYLRAVATYTDRRGVQQDRGDGFGLSGAAGQSRSQLDPRVRPD